MTKRQILIILLLVVFFGGGTIFGIFTRQGKIKLNDLLVNESPISSQSSSSKIYYTPDVPQNAVITPPVLEDSASPNIGAEEKFRSFNLKISQNGYNPQKIVVNKDDIIELKVEAIDRNYDFNLPALGIYLSMKKGETKKTSFGVRNSGTFIFDCRDYCPLNKKINGSLIVLP